MLTYKCMIYIKTQANGVIRSCILLCTHHALTSIFMVICSNGPQQYKQRKWETCVPQFGLSDWETRGMCCSAVLRALWNTPFKSLIVSVNVTLIGLTMWEELLNSAAVNLKSHSWLLVCASARSACFQNTPSNVALLKSHTNNMGKKSYPKLAWKRSSCSFRAKCTLTTKANLKACSVPKSNQDGPWKKRSETRRDV